MSTTTDTFNFIKPDITDNISPSQFNENFDKLESLLKDLMVDYVVACGTQGNWEYRRWSSGLAECWIEEYTVNKLVINQANWGGFGSPVYRLYNSANGDHFYTSSEDEKNHAVSIGYTWEGDIGSAYKLYQFNIPSPGDYPFKFKYAPLVIPTNSNRGTSSVTYSFPIWSVPDGTVTKCSSFQGIDPTAGTVTNFKMAVYVKGRWK